MPRYRKYTPRLSDEYAHIAEVTVAEERVWHFIAQGWSDPEIAEELVCSVKTVKSHSARLRDKLGVRNRTELAILYLRQDR